GEKVLGEWSQAGPGLRPDVRREATREASRDMRYVVAVAPGLYPAFEPAVRRLAAWPLWRVVESLVGLALAWRSHAVIARTPFSAAGINHREERRTMELILRDELQHLGPAGEAT